MGHKINPRCFRIENGNASTWSSIFYSSKKQDLVDFVANSINLHRYIAKDRKSTFIGKFKYEKSSDGFSKLSLYSSKINALLGKKAENISKINEKFASVLLTDPSALRVEIKEIKREDLVASLVAANIANQIEARSSSYKRACRNLSDRVMSTGSVRGIRIAVSGRLNGAEKASIFKIQKGSCPLHTLRADIDSAMEIAKTKYGILGVRVTIAHGKKEVQRLDTYAKKNKI